MAKETRNSIELVNPAQSVSQLADRLFFAPSPNHRKMKAKFWSNYMPSPFKDVADTTQAELAKYCGLSHTTIERYLKEEGFRDWLLNVNESRERLEYLYNLWTDRVERILLDDSTAAQTVVTLGKTLGELANKFPNRWAQEKFSDEDINKMSESQLKAFLDKARISVVSPVELVNTDDPTIISIDTVASS